MKKAIVLVILFQFCFIGLFAQSSLPPVDKSPMDMSYYPANYPVLKIQDKITDPLAARVIYSRPQKAGRAIFGGLVKYGEVWRVGANEATEIEFFKNVRIGGKKISKGRYTLYVIANETSWTIIVSKDTDTWGSFKYNQKKDVVRTDVPVQKTDGPVESLAMAFEKSTLGFNLIIGWDIVKVSVPISF
ncbi:MAG TPA: DUF2911 domain-containing protein [Chitinophagaceae bacterium]|jgi:hypothetical protein|nr:DUF2911 domain-containing protein [Chitinophagaceae bacterium]